MTDHDGVRAQLQCEVSRLRASIRDRVAPEHVVGGSPVMRQVLATVEQVAASHATVLIAGEAGTGKDLIANVLHERSPRAEQPFIKLHCAGLASSYVDRELERDVALAGSGTLFLDEVGELPASSQVDLLQVLQETLHSGMRLVAATTTDLREAVARGRFRSDLFYRLAVISLALPPLRERGDDILALANLFATRAAHRLGKASDGFTLDAVSLLNKYSWPGNVRELEDAVDDAVARTDGNLIAARHLPMITRPIASERPRIPGATLAELERYAILETLEAMHGSTSKTAKALRLSTRTIQYRLHDYAK